MDTKEWWMEELAKMTQRAEAAESALVQCQDELDDLMAQRDAAEAELTQYIGWKLSAQLESQRAEAALAAVPVAEMRRLVVMQRAHQWSGVESPALWGVLKAWLETQP